MGKLISKIKIISFIVILLEILILAAFSVFYFYNFFGFADLIEPLYIAIGAIALVVFNVIFVWSISLSIGRLRQKTDLRAAEVIGSDIQEAYNFAMIGLAICDENNIVLWTNDLFSERHLDIVDSDILAWQPSLAELKNGYNQNATVKISVNTRTYEVKHIPDAGLWIFKDITDYESVFVQNRNQAPVIGILAIDNYDDVVRGDDDFNDVVTKVKNVIFQYCKDYDILLRKIKDDSYSILCTYECFQRIKSDNFSIIDRVREVGTGEDIPLTLSIGFALNNPGIVRLNELANDAIDIAMSRGGDQVVVNSFGHDMEFFGGKSEAQEKRNRVKVRVLADSLVNLLSASESILVMGHIEMDMDAFGACLGIKAISDRLNKPCHIVVDLKHTEKKTRTTLLSNFTKDELDNLVMTPKQANESLNENTAVVVVDVHTDKATMCPSLLSNEKCAKVMVIDHHRRGEDYIDSPVFNHIDPASSSTCELITEFIRFASLTPKIELPSLYASIMLSGIFLDSSCFKSRSTGIRTFEAASILREFGADNTVADDFLKDDYEEHIVVNNIIDKAEHPFNGVLLCVANEEVIYDTTSLARAANACLTFKGIRATFVLGYTANKQVKLCARSDGSVNVQVLCEKLGGGGHFTMSAALFEKQELADVKQSLLNVLNSFLESATNNQANRNMEDE